MKLKRYNDKRHEQGKSPIAVLPKRPTTSDRGGKSMICYWDRDREAETGYYSLFMLCCCHIPHLVVQ